MHLNFRPELLAVVQAADGLNIYLFFELFGLLIFVALLGLWVVIITVRHPLLGKGENLINYLPDSAKKYEGRPCMQMKIALWTFAAGTILFQVVAGLFRP